MGGMFAGVSMDDQMDCTSSLLAHHEKPKWIDSAIEPKKRKMDDDEKLAENVNKTKRLTQLKKDIAVLEAAVRRGQETVKKMLHIAVEDMTIDPLSRQEDLLRRRDLLIAKLVSTQNITGKKNRVQRLENGSMVVNLLEDSEKSSKTPFLKVEAWELKKCGCDFCDVYSPSRIELPPRV
uniref:REM-1 domain-containing protein n=1 Tax=Elaeophora elaphi TaxID=1147741 RepID=A0A0R3RXH7_9BILA